MILKYKDNNTEISIVHKIKLCKNRKTSIEKSISVGFDKKTQNLSSFYTEKADASSPKKREIVCAPEEIFHEKRFSRILKNRHESSINEPGFMFAPSVQYLNDNHFKLAYKNRNSYGRKEIGKMNKNDENRLSKGTF